MELQEFWEIIEKSKQSAGTDQQAQYDAIKEMLSQMLVEEIMDFERHFQELQSTSWLNVLWGAAYLINGGCSDDCFDYFRSWLVAQGKDVFEKAVENPDSLADYEEAEEDKVEFEDLLYLSNRVYKEKIGENLPDSVYVTVYGSSGEDWDFDDENEMKKRYPKLCTKFY